MLRIIETAYSLYNFKLTVPFNDFSEHLSINMLNNHKITMISLPTLDCTENRNKIVSDENLGLGEW